MECLEIKLGNVGDIIKVKPDGSLYYLTMAYEGMMDGDWRFGDGVKVHAFANKIPYTDKIVSWRATEDEILNVIDSNPKQLILASDKGIRYAKGTEEYEKVKKILTAAGVWKD